MSEQPALCSIPKVFPFLIDGSKLVFIGVIDVQTPMVRGFLTFKDMDRCSRKSSRSDVSFQESSAEGAKRDGRWRQRLKESEVGKFDPRLE